MKMRKISSGGGKCFGYIVAAAKDGFLQPPEAALGSSQQRKACLELANVIVMPL